VLHLPDVAELVGDQVLRDVGTAEEDHAVRREAVVALPGREAEEPRRDDELDAVDTNGPRPPVETVEASLRPDEARVRSRGCLA
jgi:hypothetical protein